MKCFWLIDSEGLTCTQNNVFTQLQNNVVIVSLFFWPLPPPRSRRFKKFHQKMVSSLRFIFQHSFNEATLFFQSRSSKKI